MRTGPGLGTVVWLAARGGRADRVRIALTAASSAVATLLLLGATAVAWIGPDDGPYASQLLWEPGLHQGVVIACCLLSIPVLALAGQCSRIGAPARDRRLAAYRLGGATPREASWVVGMETALAAGVGSLLGLAGYLVGRVLLDAPLTVVDRYVQQTVRSLGSRGYTINREALVGPAHLLPTDVLAPWWVLALTVAALPVGAVLLGMVALRRVVVSPFGVARRANSSPPRVLPAVLFLIGTAGMAGFSGLSAATGMGDQSDAVVVLVLLALFVVTSVGLLFGVAAISAFLGKYVASRTRHPAVLIAGRRLAASPFSASRAHAVVLLVVLVGGVTQGVRAAILTMTANSGDDLYRDVLNLVNLVLVAGLVLAAAGVLVQVAETVVTARQAFAALTATGTPRSVLRRGLLLEAVLPLVPTTIVAAAAGVLGARGVFGTTTTDYTMTRRGESFRVVPIPVPWAELTLVVGVALGASALMAAVALTFVRRSTDVRELRTAG